ncbi:hypothetical protein MA16_Dca009656 [Dendrobium catenatum]|uniref:Uncharacterized protein n=1 Tax=Dendrobium catenatum TaxID=906689 RepID=A0A2I0VSM2_9ASPA|nr:hypothetical protein MA16_Dca009656 [Dendrobium catenatum]
MGLRKRAVMLILFLLVLCFLFSVQGRKITEMVESISGVFDAAASGGGGGLTSTKSSGGALFRSSVRKVPNASDPLHNR